MMDTDSASDSDLPMIGIFWVVEGEIHSVKLLPSAAPLTEGIRDVEANHYSHWPKIRRRKTDRQLPGAYDYYARGRIVYREAEGKFSLYADRCILASPDQLGSLVREFHLPPHGVEYVSDFHYQCHRCNKDFLSFESDED